jgi:hypothetical protein
LLKFFDLIIDFSNDIKRSVGNLSLPKKIISTMPSPPMAFTLKENQINFVNYKFTFQRLEKKYRKHWCKKKTLFDVFNRILTLYMKV